MRADLIESQIGKVVALDLVSGHQVVTRLESLSHDKLTVNCADLRIFSIQVVNGPHGPEGKVQNFPYGEPLFKLGKRQSIDLAHIIMILPVGKEMEEAYIRSVSGIVPANPGVLDQLKDVDFTKLGG